MGNRVVLIVVLVGLIGALGGFVGGRLSAPPQTVLQMSTATPQQTVQPPPAPPESSLLASSIAALGECVDQGQSQLGAPHSCRWPDGGAVGVMVHWWGTQRAPSRAYVAFSVASVNASNVTEALTSMIDLSLAFVRAFSPPDGFFSGITPTNPEASFRSGNATVTLHEHRLTASMPPMMITVDVTVGD